MTLVGEPRCCFAFDEPFAVAKVDAQLDEVKGDAQMFCDSAKEEKRCSQTRDGQIS